MPAPWTWVWMLLAVMNLTLAQSVTKDDSDASPELRSPKASNSCQKCYILYPKKEYRVRSQEKSWKKPHNVVVLVQDRKTGRTVKLAFLNGIKNKKGVRVLKPWFKSKDPCRKSSKRCVYRLTSRRTGRAFKIDFKEGFKDGKRFRAVHLAP